MTSIQQLEVHHQCTTADKITSAVHHGSGLRGKHLRTCVPRTKAVHCTGHRQGQIYLRASWA